MPTTLFLDRHKLLPGAWETFGVDKDDDGNVVEYVRMPILDPSLRKMDSRYESKFIVDDEIFIGYKFREKRHLVIALMHGVYNHILCIYYRKYDDLGDGISGVLVTVTFLSNYPFYSSSCTYFPRH